MSQIFLDRIGATSLYKPRSPEPGGDVIFLRWIAGDAPEHLRLEETWSEVGTPSSVGYFFSLNRTPPDGLAAVFEQAARSVLPPKAPRASGFVWATYRQQESTVDVSVLTLLAIDLDVENRPSMAADVVLKLPAGFRVLGFGKGTRVLPSFDGEGGTDGFVITYPDLAAAPPQTRLGISLPMAGAAVGCLCFTGLINAAAAGEPDSVLKTVVQAQIDPLRPFDARRTFEVLTGRDYLLSRSGTGYHLSPAP